MNELIPKLKIIDYVNKYELLKSKMLNILNAQEDFNNTENPCPDFHYSVCFDYKKDECLYLLKRDFWDAVFKELEYRQYLTQEEMKKYDETFNASNQFKHDFKDVLPEFTEANIWTTLSNINPNELLEKLISEMWSILKPRQFREYKTNQKKEIIAEKLIFERYISYEPRWDSWDINYYRRDHLNIIQKVFHLIDGKGIPKYPNVLSQNIYAFLREKKTVYSDDYFQITCHKNGNAHFIFKRTDLLEIINDKIFNNILSKAA